MDLKTAASKRQSLGICQKMALHVAVHASDAAAQTNGMKCVCVCVCVCGGGGGGGGGGSSVERRDSPDPSSRLASFTLRGEKAGRFREVAGVSIVNTDGPCSAVNTFNGPFTGTDLCILSQEHSL